LLNRPSPRGRVPSQKPVNRSENDEGHHAGILRFENTRLNAFFDDLNKILLVSVPQGINFIKIFFGEMKFILQ